jgi:methylenetetrahydrofolate dehydrogenase (NADP+) / methenyltetrahydrofolate cyclohydrolase
MKILDGKALSEILRDQIKEAVSEYEKEYRRYPRLSVILVGTDPASETYVGNKLKYCAWTGMQSSLLRFDSDITENQLLEKIAEINQDPDIDGLLVQLPLPAHIHVNTIIESIDPAKDVDGFHPLNMGRMMKNMDCFIPATPLGILELIQHYQIETSGKHCVVLGRSQIVGSPVSILMSRKGYPGDASVTLVHSRTSHIGEICRTGDILISAMGKPGFLGEDMVKEGAVIIDVGTTRVKDPTRKSGFRLMGDVDFEKVAPKCSYITPVPGGVGPMTITALLKNTLQAAVSRQNNK